MLKLEQLENDLLAHDSRFWPMKSISRTYRELKDIHAENERWRTCEEIFFSVVYTCCQKYKKKKTPFPTLCKVQSVCAHTLNDSE